MTNLLSEVNHLVANDVDELTERARALQWQMDYFQLERGQFQADILSYRCQEVEIIWTQWLPGAKQWHSPAPYASSNRAKTIVDENFPELKARGAGSFIP
jgi:hypothetical protein